MIKLHKAITAVLKTTIRVEGNTRYIEDHTGLLPLIKSTRHNHDQSYPDHDESESHSRSQVAPYTKRRSRSMSPSLRRAPVREDSRDHGASRKKRSRSRSRSRDRYRTSRSRSPGYGKAKRARHSPSPPRHLRIEKTISMMRKESDRIERRPVDNRDERRRRENKTYPTEHSHREERRRSRSHDRTYSSNKDRNYSSGKYSPEHRASSRDFDNKNEKTSKRKAEIIAEQEITEKYDRISKSYAELMRKIDSAKKHAGLKKESGKKESSVKPDIRKGSSEETVEKSSSTVKRKAAESKDTKHDSKARTSSKSGEPGKVKKPKAHKKESNSKSSVAKDGTDAAKEGGKSKSAKGKSVGSREPKKRVPFEKEHLDLQRKEIVRTRFEFKESKAVGGRSLNMAIQSRNWDGLGEMVAAENRSDCRQYIWIFGDLNVYQATHIAKYHIRGPNLYLPQDIQLVWIGIPGLLLSEVGVALRCFMDTHQHMNRPNMMILHVGTEDVRNRIDAESAKEAVRKALWVLRKTLPSTRLVWSEVLLNRSTPYNLQNVAKILKRAAVRQMETMQNTDFCKNSSFYLKVDFFRPKMMYLNNAMDLIQRFKLFIVDNVDQKDNGRERSHHNALDMDRSRHGESRFEKSRHASEKSRHDATESEKGSLKGSEAEKGTKEAPKLEKDSKGSSETEKNSNGDMEAEKNDKGDTEAEKGTEGVLETDKVTEVGSLPKKETNECEKSEKNVKEASESEKVSTGDSVSERGTEGPSETDKGTGNASEPEKSNSMALEPQKSSSDASEPQKSGQGEPIKGLFQPKTKHGMWNPIPWPQMESAAKSEGVPPSVFWPAAGSEGTTVVKSEPPSNMADIEATTKKTTAPGPQRSTGTCDSGSKTSQLNQSVAQCLRSLSETEAKEEKAKEVNIDSVNTGRQILALVADYSPDASPAVLGEVKVEPDETKEKNLLLVADYSPDASPPVIEEVKEESDETKKQNLLLVADYTSDTEETMVEEATEPNPAVNTESSVEKMEVDPPLYGKSEESVAKWLSEVESNLKSAVNDDTAPVAPAKIKSEPESETTASSSGVETTAAVEVVVKTEEADIEVAKTPDEPVVETTKSGEELEAIKREEDTPIDKVLENILEPKGSRVEDSIPQSTSGSAQNEQVKNEEIPPAEQEVSTAQPKSDVEEDKEPKVIAIEPERKTSEAEPEGNSLDNPEIVEFSSQSKAVSGAKDEASGMEVKKTSDKTESLVIPQVGKSDAETVTAMNEAESAMEVDVTEAVPETKTGESGEKSEKKMDSNTTNENHSSRVPETSSETKQQESNAADSDGKEVVHDPSESKAKAAVSGAEIVKTSSDSEAASANKEEAEISSGAVKTATPELSSEPKDSIDGNSKPESTSESPQNEDNMDAAEKTGKSEVEEINSETKEAAGETKVCTLEAKQKTNSETSEPVLEATSEAKVSNTEDCEPQSISEPVKNDELMDTVVVGQQPDAKPIAEPSVVSVADVPEGTNLVEGSTPTPAAEAVSQYVTPTLTAQEQNMDTATEVSNKAVDLETTTSEQKDVVSDAQVPTSLEESGTISGSKEAEVDNTEKQDNSPVVESIAEPKDSTDSNSKAQDASESV